MEHLWRRYPALRRAALVRSPSIAFSAFWSTSVSCHGHTERPSLYSAAVAGFGIAGAAGALAAPLAGDQVMLGAKGKSHSWELRPSPPSDV